MYKRYIFDPLSTSLDKLFDPISIAVIWKNQSFYLFVKHVRIQANLFFEQVQQDYDFVAKIIMEENCLYL